MEQGDKSMRDLLLARLPQPENLAAYRQEVAAGLAKSENRLRWEKWVARALWAYVLGFSLFCFYRGQQWLATPNGQKFEFASLFMCIVGVMQLVKYFNYRSRVEILREVKQVQLQVLELQASLMKEGGR
jgi:hypothetical protein